MVHITTNEELADRQRTPRDVYFEALEEAYGHLPVPSDDYADIEELLTSHYLTMSSSPSGQSVAQGLAKTDIDKLQDATEVIREHYLQIARLLKKTPRFG